MAPEGAVSNARLVIVGGTYFPDVVGDNGARIRCVLAMLQRMKLINLRQTDQGFNGEAYPIVIADASPGHMHDYLSTRFEAHGATVLDARAAPGIATQNQAAIGYALEHGAARIVRTELEKNGLAVERVLLSIRESLYPEGPNIVCIGRSPNRAYMSLPKEQQFSERIMSRALASLGLPEDTACGLRAMSRAGAELFMQFDSAKLGNQWQILWFTLIDAIASGAEVGSVFVDLMHPEGMTALETDNPAYIEKRVQQAAQLIPAVVAYGISRGLTPAWDPNREWII